MVTKHAVRQHCIYHLTMSITNLRRLIENINIGNKYLLFIILLLNVRKYVLLLEIKYFTALQRQKFAFVLEQKAECKHRKFLISFLNHHLSVFIQTKCLFIIHLICRYLMHSSKVRTTITPLRTGLRARPN